MYRYILRESCSQFDSLPLTSLTIPLRKADAVAEAAEGGGVSPRSLRGSSHSSSLAMSYVGSAAFSHLDIAHIRFGPSTPEAAAAAAAAMAAEVEMDDAAFALA